MLDATMQAFFPPTSLLGFPGGGISNTIGTQALRTQWDTMPPFGAHPTKGGAFLSGGGFDPKGSLTNFLDPVTSTLSGHHSLDTAGKQRAMDILRGKSAFQTLIQGDPRNNVLAKFQRAQAAETGGSLVPGHTRDWLRSRRQQRHPPVWHPNGSLVLPGSGPVGGSFVTGDDSEDMSDDDMGIFQATGELQKIRRDQAKLMKSMEDDYAKQEGTTGAGAAFVGAAAKLGVTGAIAYGTQGKMGKGAAGMAAIDVAAKSADLLGEAAKSYSAVRSFTDVTGITEPQAKIDARQLKREAEEQRLVRRAESLEDEHRRSRDRKDITLALAMMKNKRAAQKQKRMRTTGLAVRKNKKGKRAVIIP